MKEEYELSCADTERLPSSAYRERIGPLPHNCAPQLWSSAFRNSLATSCCSDCAPDGLVALVHLLRVFPTIAFTGRGVARGLFIAIALLGPVCWIGLFEGGYNHALKIILFRAHLSQAILQRLYPPEIYEPPNDWLFEATGVIQLVAAFWALATVLRFQRGSRKSS